MSKSKIIVIVGPTSSGKTSLSIKLAGGINGEIVSADSRQVYTGLNVGSGKVTEEEMDGVPHHLLDVCDPKETFTAADYVDMGRKAISDILNRGKVPIIIGGTGFYIDALVGRITLADVPPNHELREELKNKTTEELQQELKALDSEAHDRIDIQNPARLIRAIEIAKNLGSVPKRTMVDHSDYDVLWIGLAIPLLELKERIHTRLLDRLDKEGMLNEAKQLHSEGLSFKRMEELGLEYRYMARHLQGEISYNEMLKQLEIEIGKYAKRQMTWFKQNENINWIAPTDVEKAIELSTKFIEQ